MTVSDQGTYRNHDIHDILPFGVLTVVVVVDFEAETVGGLVAAVGKPVAADRVPGRTELVAGDFDAGEGVTDGRDSIGYAPFPAFASARRSSSRRSVSRTRSGRSVIEVMAYMRFSRDVTAVQSSIACRCDAPAAIYCLRHGHARAGRRIKTLAL